MVLTVDTGNYPTKLLGFKASFFNLGNFFHVNKQIYHLRSIALCNKILDLFIYI